jgi:hypothetical protein
MRCYFCPKELENAIEVEVLDERWRHQTDVRQGFFNIVNQFTYVDPAMAHDNPLIDQFLQPDPDDASILRRKYLYPGLNGNATVRVTGKKRFLPITGDSDYLIIQNLFALKLAMLGVERIENNNFQEGQALIAEAVNLLADEVKQHMLDPMQVLKRKANYDADLASYPTGSCGYTRAWLAHMVPNAMMMGKSELGRLLDMSEMRLIAKGQFVGTLEHFNATVENGRIAFPARVGSVVAAEICGHAIDLRSVYFEFQENGPGAYGCGCARMLVDEGEMVLRDTGERRRMYRLTNAAAEDGSRLNFIGKLRWMKKKPEEQMVIRNLEAHRLQVQSILHEKAEKWQEAAASAGDAMAELERELREYLSGVKVVASMPNEDNFAENYFGGSAVMFTPPSTRSRFTAVSPLMRN